ncbi:serine hydrolase domain-containing protein [Emticicia agri]|uniref:Class C beta-lactamase-related serine hydrolase n=1 Tax=Emticicia agri TaxID=2492393 RepID=A0A4Q5M203_9BACT|nr:serine hydrolase [Emticicia agri]RYU96262.1 class C beta-lactamase-related serine hydrolase [Emticicia agri]
MKKLILTLLVLFPVCHATYGQTKDLVQTDGFVNPLHQANVGRIAFLPDNIPIEQLKESDFLTSFELKPVSDLSIRPFLANSITNYLHQLAPDVPADEIITKGNYQFSFYVDGKLIYKENLHHGAGLKKHTTTTFRVPITTSKGEDWWAVYMFNRFLLRGGEDALTDGTHQLKIEMRPYINLGQEVKVGDLIALGDIKLIIKTPELTREQIAVQPIQPNSGWELSKAAVDTQKIEEMNRLIALNKLKEITSVVVIKDGKLLLEEYFNKADRNTLHDTRSVGKSFASAMMGIAIQEGYIKDENQTLDKFYDLKQYANYSTKKDSVKIKDLLRMSSAFNGSDSNMESPGNEEYMYPTANWVKFGLDLGMDDKKISGNQWDYFTVGVVLLGDILNKSVPESLEKYADKKLFSPLGITRYEWQYTPQKVANTAGGLRMSALDYAKFGQLYQNKGKWNGKQVMSQQWVAKTFTKYLPIPGRTNEYYGYLFWNKTYTINGKDYETFYCAGNGGSKIFIFKDIPLTIVVTAKAYNRPYGHPQVDKMMQEYILPAVVR